MDCMSRGDDGRNFDRCASKSANPFFLKILIISIFKQIGERSFIFVPPQNSDIQLRDTRRGAQCTQTVNVHILKLFRGVATRPHRYDRVERCVGFEPIEERSSPMKKSRIANKVINGKKTKTNVRITNSKFERKSVSRYQAATARSPACYCTSQLLCFNRYSRSPRRIGPCFLWAAVRPGPAPYPHFNPCS